MAPQLQQFVKDFQGEQGIGDTPANDGECVGLVEKWFDTLGGEPHVWGNACDLMANADRDAYGVTPNEPDNYPIPGDVICWEAGWGGSSVGHTAVVTGADTNSFTVFEQNDRIGGGDGSCRLFHFNNYAGVQGWIHPKALDLPDPSEAPAVPAPPAEPAPEPVPAPSELPDASAPDPVPGPVPDPVPSDTSANVPTSEPAGPILPPMNKENDVTPIKPGYKTTEFYVSLVLLALPLVNLALGTHVSADSATLFVTTLASSVAAVVGPVSYVVGRLSLKGAK